MEEGSFMKRFLRVAGGLDWVELEMTEGEEEGPDLVS